MFFNEDILFRNGSLALVWMAGNDEFKDKKRRNKLYQAVLMANITLICKDLRNLFPTMGTAHGLGLKKMGTLLKGVGVMYSMKIDNFSHDVFNATIALKRPVTLADPRIDVVSKSKAKGVANQARALLSQNHEFGEIHMTLNDAARDHLDRFDDFRAEDHEHIFGTPRRAAAQQGIPDVHSPVPSFRIQESPSGSVRGEGEQQDHTNKRLRNKRKREENTEETMYQDVLQKLREATFNPRAHCLPEDPPIALRLQDEMQQEFDFGGDQAIFNIMNAGDGEGLIRPGSELDLQQNFDLCDDDLQLPSRLPEEVTSVTALELDARALETPIGAETRPENKRRRRNDERDPDNTMMELNPVEVEERRRRLVRSRRRILIDNEIMISAKEWRDLFNSMRAGPDLNALGWRLEETRAPPKSMWNMAARGVDCILLAGRPCLSKTLLQMTKEILESQQKRLIPIKLVDAEVEKQRESVESAVVEDISAGPSGLQGGRSGITFPEISVAHQHEVASSIRMDQEEERLPEMDEYFADDMPLLPAAGEFEPPPLQSTPPVLEREPYVNVLNEDGTNFFHELYSPAEYSRKRAAMAFFTLLKMQAKRQINMVQDTPFGPIKIVPMHPGSTSLT